MKISIAIITKNNFSDLRHCLSSLISQSDKIDEIIVVDSSTTPKAKNITSQIARKTRFPVRYFFEEKKGFPAARNTALRISHHNWLAFIDDDCIAEVDWIKKIRSLAVNYSRNGVAIILGETKNYFPKNIYAVAFQYINLSWLNSHLNEKKQFMNYEAIDNRNVLLNKKLIKEKNISYNEQLLFGGEDIDIGSKLFDAKLKAMYYPQATIKHKWPTSLKGYLSKKLLYAKANRLVRKTVALKKIQRNRKRDNEVWRDITNELNPIQKIETYFLLRISGVMNRLHIF